MNEREFILRWNQERSMYESWGALVVSEINSALEKQGYHLSSFLKQPVKPRVKDEDSLIDKAFYRDKGYDNPYDEIEDKVGCRFVVLLVEHINEITKVISQKSNIWDSIECRHFSSERDKEPLLFTYQSVHYVVRAKKATTYNGIEINSGTPCEIQIRTLLQHAYAELTHDAVYKAKTLVQPKVHRTVAKSMALIETTDEFFSTVNKSLNFGTVENLSFQEHLNDLYNSKVGLNCTQAQKSSIVILDTFENLIDDKTINKLDKFINKNEHIIELIKQGRNNYPFYSQSIVIFLYWLIKKKKTTLKKNWPLDGKIIQILATEIGVSLEDFG